MPYQFTLHRHAAGNINGEHGRPDNRAFAYLAAFVAGSLASVALLWCATTALSTVDRLTAPPVSGTWCIDSRFAWLKQTQQWKDAAVIAVGSSATFRNLNFEVVSDDAKKQGVMNLAPCFLTVNQTRYLTGYLVDRARSPQTVMTVVAMRDFEGCSRNRTDFFDPDIADGYINSDSSGWWLYFRNLRLNDIMIHALYAHQRRQEVKFGSFGSGPLIRDPPETGRPFKPEIACYSELTELARSLEAKDIQLIVATFPIMKAWSTRYDPQRTTEQEFKRNVEDALADTQAILVDGVTGWHVPDAAFADPVHLQWPETAAFTRFVWRSARQLGAKIPPLGQWPAGEHRWTAPANDRWDHLSDDR